MSIQLENKIFGKLELKGENENKKTILQKKNQDQK